MRSSSASGGHSLCYHPLPCLLPALGGLSVASPGWLLTAAHACPQEASPTALPAPSSPAPSCPAQHCVHLPVPSHSPRRRTYASARPSLCPLCPALGYLGQRGATVPVLLPWPALSPTDLPHVLLSLAPSCPLCPPPPLFSSRGEFTPVRVPGAAEHIPDHGLQE